MKSLLLVLTVLVIGCAQEQPYYYMMSMDDRPRQNRAVLVPGAYYGTPMLYSQPSLQPMPSLNPIVPTPVPDPFMDIQTMPKSKYCTTSYVGSQAYTYCN